MFRVESLELIDESLEFRGEIGKAGRNADRRLCDSLCLCVT